jgi:hypothetical protein
VNDDVEVVEQDPAALGEPLDPPRQQPVALLEARVDSVVDRLDLAVGAPAADEQAYPTIPRRSSATTSSALRSLAISAIPARIRSGVRSSSAPAPALMDCSSLRDALIMLSLGVVVAGYHGRARGTRCTRVPAR